MFTSKRSIVGCILVSAGVVAMAGCGTLLANLGNLFAPAMAGPTSSSVLGYVSTPGPGLAVDVLQGGVSIFGGVQNVLPPANQAYGSAKDPAHFVEIANVGGTSVRLNMVTMSGLGEGLQMVSFYISGWNDVAPAGIDANDTPAAIPNIAVPGGDVVVRVGNIQFNSWLVQPDRVTGLGGAAGPALTQVTQVAATVGGPAGAPDFFAAVPYVLYARDSAGLFYDLANVTWGIADPATVPPQDAANAIPDRFSGQVSGTDFFNVANPYASDLTGNAGGAGVGSGAVGDATGEFEYTIQAAALANQVAVDPNTGLPLVASQGDIHELCVGCVFTTAP